MFPDWQRYASARLEARVRERPQLPSARLPSEIELQARWFAGEFGREFATPAGDKVEIIQFGTWNREAGPDFRDTSVRINKGKIARGCIEIDTTDRSWETHGHATNPAFEETVLHVFFQSGEREFFTRTMSHRNVPQLRLDLSSMRDALTVDIPLARPGRCHAPLANSDASQVDSILAAAARFRLQRKADKLRAAIESHGRDEAVFQAVATALGYKNNRLPFTLLTQRLPLKFLREHPGDSEALLFGAAGFLDTPDLAEFAAATRSYVRGLWDQWWTFRSGMERLTLKPDLWKLGGTRPMNHPQRRIGALAALVHAWPKVVAAIGGDAERTTKLLGELRHPFWNNHYTLTSEPSPRELALIGDSRIAELFANVFVPLGIAERREAWADYAALPARLSNRTVETASTRLFGTDERRKDFMKTVAHQQGLIQIYEDFCLQDNSDCAQCPFPEQLRNWK